VHYSVVRGCEVGMLPLISMRTQAERSPSGNTAADHPAVWRTGMAVRIIETQYLTEYPHMLSAVSYTAPQQQRRECTVRTRTFDPCMHEMPGSCLKGPLTVARLPADGCQPMALPQPASQPASQSMSCTAALKACTSEHAWSNSLSSPLAASTCRSVPPAL
jgi:hypothetical protein